MVIFTISSKGFQPLAVGTKDLTPQVAKLVGAPRSKKYNQNIYLNIDKTLLQYIIENEKQAFQKHKPATDARILLYRKRISK